MKSIRKPYLAIVTSNNEFISYPGSHFRLNKVLSRPKLMIKIYALKMVNTF